MTSLQHLLPGPDDVVRCADHSRGLAVDPGGTAIGVDRVVLIETPLPWPKPVFDHPDLVEAAPILKQSSVTTRTLAYVGGKPFAGLGPDGQLPADAPVRTVITFDRGALVDAATGTDAADGFSSPVVERRFEIRSVDEMLALAIAIAEDDRPSLEAMASYHGPLQSPVALICTQGSHDVCCGSEGARFAAEAEAIGELAVFRVSHTGGHRFAPTAMTLPDGRMWADMDLDLLRSILSQTGDLSEMVTRCRGWWGAAPGPAQVAERAVFEQVGWSFDERERTVEAGDLLDGAARCVVTSGLRTWEVTVAVGRSLPTIACRRPGGLPAKQSVEYEVRGVVERSTDPVGT